MNAPHYIKNRQLRGGNSRGLYSSPAFVKNLDIAYTLNGHTGCVNALNWSSNGQYLASGSDDTKVIIWNAHAAYEKTKVIHTGHTRNIFSVKFVPGSDNRTIISAAGDRTIRVFDVEYGGASGLIMEQPCARTIYRAHHDRVKRIAVEDDGHCFMTCSEDGDVRQFDLREDHSHGDGYRPPLISYAKYQIDLNTISLNKTHPYLLAVGGSHPCAFLHDRRMLGRDMRTEWGQVPTSNAPTQCVKKFRSSRKSKSTYRGEHITALHFGTANPRELLCSWSMDDVYLFDIHGETEGHVSGTSQSKRSIKHNPTANQAQKRKRSDSPPVNDLSNLDGFDVYELMMAARSYLLNPPFFNRDYATAQERFMEALEVAVDRQPDFELSLSTELDSCVFLLEALSMNAEADFQYLQTGEWYNETIRAICHSFNTASSDPNDRTKLHDLVGHEDVPIMDVTSFHKTPRQLFSSHAALVESFNTIISNAEVIRKTHTEEGRKFWLEKVCRSLLSATEEKVKGISRPVPASVSSGDSDSELEEDSDSDSMEAEEEYEEEETHSADEDDDEESEYDVEVDPEVLEEEEYNSDIQSAIEKVNPGVSIGLPMRQYNGHVNVETVKDVNFFGLNDEYIMSGSDDGLLFIWDKKTARIVTMLQGDASVVNVMEGHPSTNTLALSGIEETVKIFQPFENQVGEDGDHNGGPRETRRVTMSEYEVRARNERRQAGLPGDQMPRGSIRLSRQMLLNLAEQMDTNGEDCRMQ